MTVLPAGRRARVRGVEVHDEPVERAAAGQRVALNLAGVDRDEVARGDVIVAGDAAPRRRPTASTSRSRGPTPDARPDGGARVAVHHGTRETAARLVELGGRFFQLRLEQPIVPAAGDRLVIRSLAPPDTLGGGVVLDPPAPPRPSRDLLARLARLERGEPEPERSRPAPPAPEPAVRRCPPPRRSRSRRELRAAGHEPPLDDELDAAEQLAALRAHGRAVRLGRDMHIHPDALAAVQDAASRDHRARRRDHARRPARRAPHLAQVRAGAARALRRRALTLRGGDARVLRRRR